MGTITISPENAILFVFDPASKNVLIPPYVDGELIAANPTCVSIGTQAPVDGETEVTMSLSNAAHPGLHRAFVGRIVTPNGIVAINTASFERVLEFEVAKTSVDLCVWVDDLRNPSQVIVEVSPIPATSLDGVR